MASRALGALAIIAMSMLIIRTEEISWNETTILMKEMTKDVLVATLTAMGETPPPPSRGGKLVGGPKISDGNDHQRRRCLDNTHNFFTKRTPHKPQ